MAARPAANHEEPGLIMLTAPNLSFPFLSHGFFTREGGKSKGLYHSLNCGLGSLDDRDVVIRNRHIVAKKLGAGDNKLAILYQVHSAETVVVDKLWRHSKMPKADAMVTKTPGIALGILTADCVPVLLCDTKNQVIGAAHAGWKGALAGIIGSTVAKMLELGAREKSIACAIGPAIAQASYEVDGLFRDRFLESDRANAQYFMPCVRDTHFLFALTHYVRDQLIACGVTDIHLPENDTYAEEARFFSYRRSTHRQETDYGRQISAIMLK